MSTNIFARESEKAYFDKVLSAREAVFLAVYGRRRIGKTFLINQFFKDKGLYFELTGLYQAGLATQLENFSIVYSDLFFAGTKQPTPTSWLEAFTALRQQIEVFPKDKKVILFFDELPWLATNKSGFIAALDLLWNRYLSRMDNVVLIVCGSAAAWMIKNILNDRGGLHGRVTHHLRMAPFTLWESQRYLESRGVHLTKKQFIEVYMAIGGVAKYLTQVERGYSAAQIINQLCFTREGYLFREFNKLYRSLFDNYEQHIKIIRLLSERKLGFTREEVVNKTDLSSGGGLTTVINELYESGFIQTVNPFSDKKKETRYVLGDYYSLFYLKWIEAGIPQLAGDSPGDYWLKQQRTPRWYNWAGHSFENICLQNIERIKAALGISAVSTTFSGWQSEGVQIDGVLDRADNCINLFEMKFCEDEYIIDAKYAETLLNKKQLFIQKTKTKKAVFMTLITTYGAKENKYYLGSVDNQLTIEVLF